MIDIFLNIDLFSILYAYTYVMSLCDTSVFFSSLKNIFITN